MVEVSDDMAVQVLDQYHSLVRHIAKRAHYSSSTLDIEDLYQVGDMAVLRAVRAYDPSSGSNIKSFVANSIRNAIFNEAARFLGVLTVDFRITNQASYAAKLYEEGKSDHEIAAALAEKHGRQFDIDHARDLRLAYSRRQYTQTQDDIVIDNIENDLTIRDLLEGVVKDDMDRAILDKRILGTDSAAQVAECLNTSKKIIYEREASLKNRIKRAIEDAA